MAGGNAYLGSGEEIDALLLTNTSSASCALGGYPAVAFVSSSASSTSAFQASYQAAPSGMDIPTAFQAVSPASQVALASGQGGVPDPV